MTNRTLIIVGLVLVLLISGYVAHRIVLKHEMALAHVEEREAQLKKQKAELEKLVALEREKRERAEKQQQEIKTRIVTRDAQTKKQVAEVLVPKPIEAIQKDASRILGETPSVTADQKLAFTPPKVQALIALKLERDQLAQDNQDLDTVLSLAEQRITSLQVELKKKDELLTGTEKLAGDYKAVAKKSKGKKVLDGAVKIGIFAGGILIGRAL